MDGRTIRQTFLDFFAERGHTIVPSSPLVPDDPTLLFTSAGMVQFKPYFLGEKPSPYQRAASAQKCLRAVDLEEVGKDSRHLSFFEMMGNFSFGDYFKREAIRWAWELMTERYGLDPDRMSATVFETDEEAVEHWRKEVGLTDARIIRRGKEDNFWHMGVAGPCGPNSELLYDRGPDFGKEYAPGGELDDERYLEVYNLVFMQYVQDDDLEISGELPEKGVDTGLGFERLATVLQNVPTVFEMDTMAPILRRAEEVIGKRYGESPDVDVSLRVLTEHARGVSFGIADGALPSNEGRGYVLRRLIRRAVRYARLAGYDEPILAPLTEVVAEIFEDTYPEIARNLDVVRRVVAREESAFDATLRAGLGTLEEEIGAAKGRGDRRLSGRVAFKLHDTYGFPLDLTTDIAGEEGLEVDLEEFEDLMGEQRRRARAARPGLVDKAAEEEALGRLLADVSATDFLGYEHLSSDANVVALVRDLVSVPVIEEGGGGELVLDRTPFYAEAGGQVGDRGEIRTPTGVFSVEDTQWGVPGIIVHKGKVSSGEIRAGQEAITSVEETHRAGVRQSHTATHMLHWALRSSLGEHARQKGSLVEPGRLRFDFSHFEPVAGDRMAEMEEEINRRVLVDDAVRAFETTHDFAMSIGAIALFGEKYGEFVRVVEVGEYSKELCGGTHVAHTGQVGVIKLVSEGSVGTGIRRVEALTGMKGLAYLNEQAEKLQKVAEMLKVTPDRVLEHLEKTLELKKTMEGEIGKRKALGQREEVRAILSSEAVREVGGSRLVLIPRDVRPVEELRKLAIAIRDELGSGVVVIGSSQDGRANLIAAVSRDLTDRGISANAILAKGAEVLGGGAGGKPDLAVAGGPRSHEIDRAVAAVEKAVLESLSET